jgi:hypothetical protein
MNLDAKSTAREPSEPIFLVRKSVKVPEFQFHSIARNSREIVQYCASSSKKRNISLPTLHSMISIAQLYALNTIVVGENDGDPFFHLSTSPKRNLTKE